VPQKHFMINWRTILGFVLLLVGIKELYTIIGNAAALKAGTNPLYPEIGCGMWMAIGLYFIIRGITMKKTN